MDNRITAVEVGQRCKRFRNVLGMSQQALADLMNTTPQNISKYEKEGISNIEIIQEISEILGHNLMIDEIDAEGEVGEIGKEILGALIAHGGRIDYERFKEGNYLYKLPESRIVNELFKLERIGLVVREQYTTPMKEEKDELFITAKGVITLKHIDRAGFDANYDGDESWNDGVSTYEELTSGFASMQELIDSKKYDKNVLGLGVTTAYRVNFINYIVDKLGYGKGFDDEHFPGVGIYHDIMLSMILDISRDDADFMIRAIRQDRRESNENWNEDHISNEILENDVVVHNFFYEFEGIMSGYKHDFYANDVEEDWINKYFSEAPDSKKELIDKYREVIGFNEKASELLSDSVGCLLTAKYHDFHEKKGVMNPDEWFSCAQIKEYIEKNFIAANTDAEKDIEEKLQIIMARYPEVLNYFTFPTKWEKNGVSDLIRKIFNVPERSSDKALAEKAEIMKQKKKENLEKNKPILIYVDKFIDEADDLYKRIIVKETGEVLLTSDDPAFLDATPIQEMAYAMKYVEDLPGEYGFMLNCSADELPEDIKAAMIPVED